MRRSSCLATLAIVGTVLAVATQEARQERVALELHDVAENLYMLSNASSVDGMGGGGNTAIFVTDSGVVLVDTKINGYGQDILAEVRRITEGAVGLEEHAQRVKQWYNQECAGADGTSQLRTGDELRRL